MIYPELFLKQNVYSERKHIHYENTHISNIQKIAPPKTENIQIKTMIFFMFLLKT